MDPIKVRFIVGELNDDEIDALKNNHAIITKMILSPDDYSLFRYHAEDTIEAETAHGDRIWCRIENLETIVSSDKVIIILTLSAVDKR